MVAEFLVAVHDRLHALFAQAISLYLVERLVREHGVVAQHVLVSADDRLFLQLYVEMESLVECKSDGVKAFRDIDLFIHFFKLSEDIISGKAESRLQILQQRYHEALVSGVFPRVEHSVLPFFFL